MRLNDAILGGALLAFAAALAVHARSFPAIPGQEYGAAVFPLLIAAGLGGCALVLVAGGVREWRRRAVVEADWTRSPRAMRNLGLTVGLVLLYIVAAETVGFVPLSLLILTTLATALGTRWWIALGMAALVTLLIHQTFAGLLRVPLPRGVLVPLGW